MKSWIKITPLIIHISIEKKLPKTATIFIRSGWDCKFKCIKSWKEFPTFFALIMIAKINVTTFI